ncbi:MAG: septum formation inhibitor [Lentimicrobiaceae bacterium]|nr:septum formation inhibitor [Lentimicrobiaceae bacterium]
MLKNKYFIVSLLFLVWILFLDSSNIFYQIGLRKELRDLKREKQFYQSEIAKDSTIYNELLNDTSVFEKYAREHFWLKRKGEDLFIVMDKENNSEKK